MGPIPHDKAWAHIGGPLLPRCRTPPSDPHSPTPSLRLSPWLVVEAVCLTSSAAATGQARSPSLLMLFRSLCRRWRRRHDDGVPLDARRGLCDHLEKQLLSIRLSGA